MGRAQGVKDQFAGIMGDRRGGRARAKGRLFPTAVSLPPQFMPKKHPYIVFRAENWYERERDYVLAPPVNQPFEFDMRSLFTDAGGWGPTEKRRFWKHIGNTNEAVAEVLEWPATQIMRTKKFEATLVVRADRTFLTKVTNHEGTSDTFRLPAKVLGLLAAPAKPVYRTSYQNIPRLLEEGDVVYDIRAPFLPSIDEFIERLETGDLHPSNQDPVEFQVMMNHLRKCQKANGHIGLHFLTSIDAVHRVTTKDGETLDAMEGQGKISITFYGDGGGLPFSFIVEDIYTKTVDWVAEPGRVPHPDYN